MTMNQKQQESMVLFLCGQIIGLAALLNINVLEEFLESERALGDFRYKRECEEIAKWHRRVFQRQPSKDNGK